MKTLNDYCPLIVKVTSKGQITIPKEIREKLNIKDGEVVSFYPNGDLYLFGNFQSIYEKQLDDMAKSKGLDSWKELENLIEISREDSFKEYIKKNNIKFK